MKKIFLGILILLLASLSLTACGNADLPDGMQLVYGSEEDGYFFYGPAEWVVSNADDVKCTYVSRLDQTSVTFVKSELPVTDASRKEAVDEFFNSSNSRLNTSPFSNYVLLDPEFTEGTNPDNPRLCDFGSEERGKADEAYKYVYTYTYEGKPYKTMQIFVFFGEDFYIFTFSSSAQRVSDAEDAVTFFDEYYASSIKKVIDNFTFKSKIPAQEKPLEYEKDADGNLLISDKSMCGFSLWVPEAYSPDYSSAIVSATHTSGANITVSKLIDSTISIKDNYLNRIEKLKAFSDKELIPGYDDEGNAIFTELPLFTEIKGVKLDAEGNETLNIIDLPNARSAAEFEYTYTIDGATYHVYQVYVVQGYLSIDAYVFTFTAKEEDYSARIDEAISILKRMEY